MTPPGRRSSTIDELERRYLALHGGDREAAARNLAVDLMAIEARTAGTWSQRTTGIKGIAEREDGFGSNLASAP